MILSGSSGIAAPYDTAGDDASSVFVSHLYMQQGSDSVEVMIADIEKLLTSAGIKEALKIAVRLKHLLTGENLPDKRKIYPLILVGTTYLLNEYYNEAEPFYLKALELLKLHPVDALIDKAYYNLGVIYTRKGDFIKADSYFEYSFNYIKNNLRHDHPKLAREYLARSIAKINLREYEKGLEMANKGLEIAKSKPDSVDNETLRLLYQTKGTLLAKSFDYHQSILNLRKAQGYYEVSGDISSIYYINNLGNIITTCYFLGRFNDCDYYFEKSKMIPEDANSSVLFDLSYNYASILAENGNKKKGLELLTNALNKVSKDYHPASREHTYALQKYAGYILEYEIDISRSLDLLGKCYGYIKSHPWDISLKNEIILGYSTALGEKGNYSAALDSIRSLFYRQAGLATPADIFQNPPDSLLRADKLTFEILYTKYKILRKLFLKEKEIHVLMSSVNTAERMISVLEKIRLNIGEEDSRLLLGNKYRVAYLNVIQMLSDCYTLTGEFSYLEKAFEYSEKSKAASLLASIREMKAIDGIIPAELAEMERNIEKTIGLYVTSSETERLNEKPDSALLDFWNEKILSSTSRRDSLKKEFEKNYPDYYSLKYNTRVVKISEIGKLIGRNKNYLSYIVFDSTIYIMVVNSEFTGIEKVRVDTSFNPTVLKFRQLLSSPDRSSNARREFAQFQKSGYKLYTWLIEPVMKYLVSDELILSPDNSLAFFPFEAFVTSEKISDDLQYRSLPYLMNQLRISHAYSATLLSESTRTKRTYRNRVLAFAPSYSRPIYSDSLYVNRQETEGLLPQLKYAAEEASFISRFTSGKLFRDSSATKTLFTDMAGNFDIIHLAMHTVLKHNDPGASGMIFSKSDSAGDEYLRPYEINALRLNAKMVVLSSCFTGAGVLFAGEGVLSIARGFIFAGSRSVVMSLWEVDDRSGTEIIKLFYRNLKSGRSKSESLRRARIDYLRDADMLHAHPYFWSTMVVYGDDSPVYISIFTRILFLIIPVLLAFYFLNYFRKR